MNILWLRVAVAQRKDAGVDFQVRGQALKQVDY